MKKKLPLVAIVGRVNVGKSTLFNRISADVKSIVLDYEGVTRDPIRTQALWRDCAFELVDTAGLWGSSRQPENTIAELAENRAHSMIEAADLILFITDGSTGVLEQDRIMAREIHKLGTPTILVVNKGDSPHIDEHLYEFNALNFKHTHTISAYHGTQVYELFDLVASLLPVCVQTGAPEPEVSPPRIVFLGRPNVGKSSLLNALLQEERAIVSAIPGTTREPIAEKISFYQQSIVLVDTPGIRRKRNIDEPVEHLMVHSALQALKDADIAVMLIDASEADIVDQELKLAFYAFEERHKGLIILFNKSDLTDAQKSADLERVKSRYKHLLDKVPTINISVKTGKNVGRVLPLVLQVWQNYTKRFDNTELHVLCMGALASRPIFRLGRPLIVHTVRQIHTRPPTMIIEAAEPHVFEKSHIGFFDRVIRSRYDLSGVPIKFMVQKRG